MSVCMYARPICVYVCQTITFESLHTGSSYLHMRYISTVYGSSSYMRVDHRVKVKVTGDKKVENSYNDNAKLRSAITPVLSNIET